MKDYNPHAIRKIEIEFSYPDMKAGAELLHRLGLIKGSKVPSESYILTIEDWMIPDLEFELESSGLIYEHWPI